MSISYIFAGDPMCSWCYGFASELAKALHDLPEVQLQIRVAGLWAHGREPLDDAAKAFRLGHWGRVEAAAGVPFNRDALKSRQGFVYDTEPISRAFVTGRMLVPNLDQLSLFRALQRLFYMDGLDTTDEAVLQARLEQELAAQGHADAARRAGPVMRSHAIKVVTQADFDRVRGWGLRSFPQLLAVRDDGMTVLSNGFSPAAQLRQVLHDSLLRA